MLPALDRGRREPSGSKKEEDFLLMAGEEGSCERVSIVRSEREGRGLDDLGRRVP